VSTEQDDDRLTPEEEAYLWDPKAQPADAVKKIEAKVQSEQFGPAVRFEVPQRSRREAVVFLAVCVMLVFAVVARLQQPPQPVDVGPALAVAQDGKEDPRGLTLEKQLVTGDKPATVKLGYGEVAVAPNSTLRLLKFVDGEHRLALDRGSLHAKVDAPPRLFNVDVPGGKVVDLGCEYRLFVADDGRREVEVATGYVELEGGGRRVTVPAGARTTWHPQGWPRTPVDAKASPAWSAALAKFEDAPKDADAAALVALAEPRDAVSLWNLLPRAEEAQRTVLTQKLKELSGEEPAPWSADDLAKLEPKAVESAWNAVVERRESGNYLPTKKGP
jgi:hypothetical protein